LKDVQAGILGIGAGLTSRDAQISEQGGDYEEVFEQIAAENKLAKSLDLDLQIQAKAPIVDKGPKDQVVEDDDADAKDDAEGTGKKVLSIGSGR
jgi:capsid protein